MDNNFFHEPSGKRRKGSHPRPTSSAGFRVVHGDKELHEKLGRNDPCPCGSGRRFQEMLHAVRALRRMRQMEEPGPEADRFNPKAPVAIARHACGHKHDGNAS